MDILEPVRAYEQLIEQFALIQHEELWAIDTETKSMHQLGVGDHDTVKCDNYETVEKLTCSSIKRVILFHNHPVPVPCPLPSEPDILFTKCVDNSLRNYSRNNSPIALVDHLVISIFGVWSIVKNKLLYSPPMEYILSHYKDHYHV